MHGAIAGEHRDPEHGEHRGTCQAEQDPGTEPVRLTEHAEAQRDGHGRIANGLHRQHEVSWPCRIGVLDQPATGQRREHGTGEHAATRQGNGTGADREPGDPGQHRDECVATGASRREAETPPQAAAQQTGEHASGRHREHDARRDGSVQHLGRSATDRRRREYDETSEAEHDQPNAEQLGQPDPSTISPDRESRRADQCEHPERLHDRQRCERQRYRVRARGRQQTADPE